MNSIDNETIVARLREQFQEAIEKDDSSGDMLTVTVTPDRLHDILRFMKEEPSMGYHYLTTLCGVHFPDDPRPFGLMVQLHNMPANRRVRFKTFTADSDPVFRSLTDIWPASNWMEREAFDFFGFRFSGHPDMRRILNMDSLEGWPLRKEYPLEDPFRKDKDDKMFGR
jgi:NADH-quinone oxidoreductase subunit C